MKELYEYLKTLTPEQRETFAAHCHTTIGYLRKAISAGDKLRVSLCVDIERHSRRAVTCEMLRPDLIDYWKYLRQSGKKRKAAA